MQRLMHLTLEPYSHDIGQVVVRDLFFQYHSWLRLIYYDYLCVIYAGFFIAGWKTITTSLSNRDRFFTNASWNFELIIMLNALCHSTFETPPVAVNFETPQEL